ncbi:PREDICTED: uncharacterized protein LOC104801581 [Tarenaya hassleriana]|uniref:uncharacterized protein LOC104801581 n=1 Tax=Tarenaya hassleriana TaxID=28532 RepID=UPI00053C1D4C|nr:PREDICTED: uncharacterized protein LOC104801581 [Tarenaya hassleriana]
MEIRDQKGRECERRDKYRDLEAALHISRQPPPRRSSPSAASAAEKEKERLVSLDVFRGVTVALMILVDDVGGIFPSINHSPWNGVTLADFVMPFFLFIVGVALAFAYKNLSCRYSATRKAVLRSLKLFSMFI